TTFAWLACLLPFYPRKIQVVLALTACLVSFSRIGIGAHYMSDVVSAAVLGYVVGVLIRDKLKLGVKV
ncbi:MAG: membrane-associated phospholipid phosphatase, partial [Alphaproteobacteria bacterium]